MAISDQLTLLNNTKTAIRTAINNKGGSVTDSTPFADYSTAIDNLPSGGDNSTLIDLIERDITSINIPSGTTSIGAGAFANISSLNSVTIPSSVTSIGVNAFTSSGITSITIPNSVTTLGNYAFSNCSQLSSVTIGSGITQIPMQCFYHCSQLNSVTIPNTVTSIGQEAYRQSGLSGQLNIPNSVTTIGQNTFTSCTYLTSLIIGTGITTINGYAFSGCSGLTAIVCNATTPPSVQTNSFNGTNNCPIYVPAASVDTYKAASGWSTYASRIYPIQQVATVDGNPVYNYDLRMTSTDTITSEDMAKMPAGTSVEFAEGLTNIATGEINYQEVTLPSTFTGFGDSDMIGSSVTTITSNAVTPPSAFRNQLGGSNLTAIYVPAASVDTYKAHAAWSGFASIIQAIPVPTAMKWTSADGTQEISIACEDLVEAGTFVIEDRENADPNGLIVDAEGSAEIGDCVTTIGEEAFNECSSLASITIPDSVTTIGDCAFMDCSSLTSVTIPDSVTTIGDWAFDSCSSLASIIIPDSVTTIGEKAFLNCISLTSVTIGNSVTTIGKEAFNGCTALTSATVNATTPPTVADRKLFRVARASLVIYVPSASVDAYKAATNWSTYADRIQAIPNE